MGGKQKMGDILIEGVDEAGSKDLCHSTFSGRKTLLWPHKKTGGET